MFFKGNHLVTKLPNSYKKNLNSFNHIINCIYVHNTTINDKINDVDNMNDVIKFLNENSLVYLATEGLDGNAKVRPILYYFEENGKPYFCTSNTKPMYKELVKNSNFEITTATPEFAWIRISGEVEFISDLTIKQKVIESNELVKSLYQSGDNPEFEVFTISGNAVIADFSGNPPKTYKI